jgi:hypothetical protein
MKRTHNGRPRASVYNLCLRNYSTEFDYPRYKLVWKVVGQIFSDTEIGTLHKINILGVQSAGLLYINFTVGTSYVRATPLAKKNVAAGFSDFSVRGAERQNFSQQVAQHFRKKFRR